MDKVESTGSPEQRAELRLGLALSGGGFRASFFHAGMLAALADIGLLHSVQVISAVSGGSHTAALYYLGVQKLLESKYDRNVTLPIGSEQISDEDYTRIVQELQAGLLAAVRKNLRMRVFSNVWKNLKMYRPDYSRSDRMGELLDQHLFGHSFKLSDLLIAPKGHARFDIDADNAERGDKVPILLINATALNCGHNWRFEAKRMGEPEADSPDEMDIDGNLRLPRPERWCQLPQRLKNFRLGHAVAASACVPGIFHPLAISNMYGPIDTNGKEQDVRIQLVDGGLHDNFGLKALEYRNCTHVIVSDGTGQMNDEPEPSTSLLSVLMRTYGIMMDRIREEELFGLYDRYPSSHAYVHLRKGIAPQRAQPMGWTDTLCRQSEPAPKPEYTPEEFQVPSKVQALLAEFRTDLDSFTEVEAYSLMLDAYQMTLYEMRRRVEDFRLFDSRIDDPQKSDWCFHQVQQLFDRPTAKYLKHLRTGRYQALKVLHLRPFASLAWSLVLLAPPAAGVWLLTGKEWWRDRGNDLLALSLADMISTEVAIVVGLVVLSGFTGAIPWLSRKFSILFGLRAKALKVIHFVTRGILPFAGAAFVLVHLQIFDRLFLKGGEISRVSKS